MLVMAASCKLTVHFPSSCAFYTCHVYLGTCQPSAFFSTRAPPKLWEREFGKFKGFAPGDRRRYQEKGLKSREISVSRVRFLAARRRVSVYRFFTHTLLLSQPRQTDILYIIEGFVKDGRNRIFQGMGERSLQFESAKTV